MSGSPRVLLLRYRCIGDLVVTTWAATAIREAYPSAYLIWAAQKSSSAVVDTERLVDGVQHIPVELEKAEPWSAKTWREVLVAHARLRRERFDVGFDFQGQFRTAMALRVASPKRRLALRQTDPAWRWVNPIYPEDTTKNQVYRCLDLVNEHLEVGVPERTIMPDVSNEDLPAPRDDDRPWVTIQTGTRLETKLYPVEMWTEVARRLGRMGFRVTVLGGPGDATLPDDVAQNWVGQTTLRQAMAAVERCDVHLSSDTGTAHIAAAYRTPSVTLFGPTSPHEWKPFSPTATVLHEGDSPTQIDPQRVVESAVCAYEDRKCAF